MKNLSNGDESYMRLALKQAYLGKSIPGAGEVGCVIVKGNEVVAEGYTQAEMRSDPTAHAEIFAMRSLAERRKTVDLRDCTLYCILQPCGMCSMACMHLEFKHPKYDTPIVTSRILEVREWIQDFALDCAYHPIRLSSRHVNGFCAPQP